MNQLNYNYIDLKNGEVQNMKNIDDIKMLPSGMILQILDTIVSKISNKFTFSYYENDDIKQEAIIKCLQILPLFSGTTISDANAFFSTCVSNYLKNLKRDKYVHIVPPCMPGGYGASYRPAGLDYCIYWDKDAPRSSPCCANLYETCEAWQTYKKHVQSLLNAANPITIEEDVVDGIYNHDIEYFELSQSIQDKLPQKLIPYYKKMLNGENIPTSAKIRIQQLASGVLFDHG